jgi:uncharacterized membrane protein YkvA (DUF1232 family)
MSDKLPQSIIERLGRKAKAVADDAQAAAKLVDAAMQKANQGKTPLSRVWSELQSTFRMLGSWIKGEYRGVSMTSVILAIAGLLYFVNPFDVVADFLPGAGLLDDATVLGFVIARIRSDLQHFLKWEAESAKHMTDSEAKTSN